MTDTSVMERVGTLPGGREFEYECPKCFLHVRRPIPKPGDRDKQARVLCPRCVAKARGTYTVPVS